MLSQLSNTPQVVTWSEVLVYYTSYKPFIPVIKAWSVRKDSNAYAIIIDFMFIIAFVMPLKRTVKEVEVHAPQMWSIPRN